MPPECFAIDCDFGPLQWRCNQPRGHYPDTPHSYTTTLGTHYEWTEE